MITKSVEMTKKKDVVKCVNHVIKLLRWLRYDNIIHSSLFVHFGILLLWRRSHDWLTVCIGLQDQLGAAIHRQDLLCCGLLALRVGSLLLLQVLVEGALNRDLLSLDAGLGGLWAGLQQMKCFAVFLCQKEKDVRSVIEDLVRWTYRKGMAFDEVAPPRTRTSG